MSVKAVFEPGSDVTVTDKLHQWDYGQTLEIEAYDLPLIHEVHFACPEMKDAIVRPCSTTNGIATVKIPDLCLEQVSPITAWVFVIDGTEGMTRKTITIPVEQKTRPNPTGDVPVEIWNLYTELISEINEAVEGLANGNITAAKANSAGSAGTAGTAGYADRAGVAASAGKLNLTFSFENKESVPIAENGLYLVEIGVGEFEPDTITSLLLVKDTSVRCVGTCGSYYYTNDYIRIWAECSGGAIFAKTDGTIEGLRVRSISYIWY